MPSGVGMWKAQFDGMCSKVTQVVLEIKLEAIVEDESKGEYFQQVFKDVVVQN